MAPCRIPSLSALGPLVGTDFIVVATGGKLFVSLNNGPVSNVEVRLSQLDYNEGVTFFFRDTHEECSEKINKEIMTRLRQDQTYLAYEEKLKILRKHLLCVRARDPTSPFLQEDIRNLEGPTLDFAQFQSQCTLNLGSTETVEKPIEWPPYPEDLVQRIVSQVLADCDADCDAVCNGTSA